jgi:hypothetical protein
MTRCCALTSLFSLLTLIAFTAEPQGLDLADFEAQDGKAVGEGWKVEADGVIHLQGEGGNLISKAEFSSFEFEWEWKVAPGGNNGVKYWVAKLGGKDWLGIEYQMIDDAQHPDAKVGPQRSTAAFYDIQAPAADKPVKPAGEWNQSKIIVRGTKLEHWLNGKLVNEADTSTEAWKEGIAKSKFKTKAGFAPGAGRLMLTDHHDETWLRNLRVRAL